MTILTDDPGCPTVNDGNRIACGASATLRVRVQRRIGKPVKFRHGPATVIGESSGQAQSSHCLLTGGKAPGGDDPSVRRPAAHCPAASRIERAGLCATVAPVLLEDGGISIIRHWPDPEGENVKR